MRPTRHATVAILLAALALGSSLVLYVDYTEARTGGTGEIAPGQLEEQAELSFDERDRIVPPADGITIIGDHPGQRLIAFAPDGRLLYYNDTLDRYHDIDPAPGRGAVVEFVGARYLDEPCFGAPKCTEMVFQRINLRTGEVDVLYTELVPDRGRRHAHRWHDIDRTGPHQFAVADINENSVFIVDTRTGERTFQWNASSEFDASSGGPPRDWTHLNDIEVLPNGWLMVSLRNQDQIVFIDPERGMVHKWTLGSDDETDILFEQHNPDYIPRARGGPAVVIADSQNDRVIEYQRQDGQWVESWRWSDANMSWPRDADRLPNGHTLIGDSNGNRILEANETGAVVWEVRGLTNYEVERLETGDESAGGYSAVALGLEARPPYEANETHAEAMSPGNRMRLMVRSVVGAKAVHAAQFLAPTWMSFNGILATVGLGVSTFGLTAVGGLVAVRRRRWLGGT